jgi:hypothetical protein
MQTVGIGLKVAGIIQHELNQVIAFEIFIQSRASAYIVVLRPGAAGR